MIAMTQAEPLDGGQLICSGRMWVNPVAEHDPRAVRVSMEGHNLPFEPLMLRYLPKVLTGRVFQTARGAGSNFLQDAHIQSTDLPVPAGQFFVDAKRK